MLKEKKKLLHDVYIRKGGHRITIWLERNGAKDEDDVPRNIHDIQLHSTERELIKW